MQCTPIAMLAESADQESKQMAQYVRGRPLMYNRPLHFQNEPSSSPTKSSLGL